MRTKVKMSEAQHDALNDLWWFPEIWWHDLPAGTREVLRRRRWLREVRRESCNTHGRKHPGYVTISKAGIAALRKEDACRGWAVVRSGEE